MKKSVLNILIIVALLVPNWVSGSTINLEIDLDGFVGNVDHFTINNVQGELVGNPLDSEFTLNVAIAGPQHVRGLGMTPSFANGM